MEDEEKKVQEKKEKKMKRDNISASPNRFNQENRVIIAL